MSTIPSRRETILPRVASPSENGLPLLCNGDHMKQPEFHERYETYPEDVKFELIGGIVYMASPLRLTHSNYDDEIGFALGMYRRATPGVQALHNATTILGEESEPQPDLGLRILPEYGGRSRTTERDYVEGPPELLVEIAHSTRAIDMHAKRHDYHQTGVLEYLVLCVEEREPHWFGLQQGRPMGYGPTAKASSVRASSRACTRRPGRPGARIPGRVEEWALRQGRRARLHAAFVRKRRSAVCRP